MTNSVVKKSSKLEDYIVHLSDELTDIRSQYEFGKLIIFDNIPTMRDKYKEFIDNDVKSIVTNDIKIKKAKAINLLKPNVELEDHILWNFTEEIRDLQLCIREITIWVFHKVFNQCFPDYKHVSQNWTWRLTQTIKDEMHLDTYAGQNNDLHNVRIFINLDDKPRIWRTSYALPDIYTKYYSIVAFYRSLHPNELNDILNKKIKWDELPYHEIYFAPWSMWMCNSQWISHQGYYGNKMAAYTFRVDRGTMLFPNLSFGFKAQSLIKNWGVRNGIGSSY